MIFWFYGFTLCLFSFADNFIEKFLGPIPDPLLNWVTELSNVSALQRWILLTNLKAATVYQFRVSAVNSVGEGSPSEPSNVIKLPQEGKFVIYILFANLLQYVG